MTPAEDRALFIRCLDRFERLTLDAKASSRDVFQARLDVEAAFDRVCGAPRPSEAPRGELGECSGHLGPPGNTATPHAKGPTCSFWKPLRARPSEAPAPGACPKCKGKGLVPCNHAYCDGESGCPACGGTGRAPAPEEGADHG
jgi:hypothetical protein